MPTQNTIEVINVSTDVYRLKTIKEHFAEEQKSATYVPLIHKRTVSIRGQQRTAFNICRVPESVEDRAFIEDQRNTTQRRLMTYPFFCVASKGQLFTITNGELVAI